MKSEIGGNRGGWGHQAYLLRHQPPSHRSTPVNSNSFLPRVEKVGPNPGTFYNYLFAQNPVLNPEQLWLEKSSVNKQTQDGPFSLRPSLWASGTFFLSKQTLIPAYLFVSFALFCIFTLINLVFCHVCSIFLHIAINYF